MLGINEHVWSSNFYISPLSTRDKKRGTTTKYAYHPFRYAWLLHGTK